MPGPVPPAGPSTSAVVGSITGGRITFVSAPAVGAALTWSGQFYKRVRFARDETEFEEFLQDLWSAKKVELITVKA